MHKAVSNRRTERIRPCVVRDRDRDKGLRTETGRQTTEYMFVSKQYRQRDRSI